MTVFLVGGFSWSRSDELGSSGEHGQTFCCVICGYAHRAEVNAAENLTSRLTDQELIVCADHMAIKALIKAFLQRRHQTWHSIQRLAVVQPPAQLSRQRGQVTG